MYMIDDSTLQHSKFMQNPPSNLRETAGDTFCKKSLISPLKGEFLTFFEFVHYLHNSTLQHSEFQQNPTSHLRETAGEIFRDNLLYLL